MKATSMFLATLSGAIILYSLGYVFYIIILDNVDLTIKSVAKIERDPVVFPAILLMELTYAFLMAFIFSKWAGIKTISSGLIAGALIGFLIGLSVGLEYFATTYILSINGILLKALTFAIRFSLAGAVIAWILGKNKE